MFWGGENVQCGTVMLSVNVCVYGSQHLIASLLLHSINTTCASCNSKTA